VLVRDAAVFRPEAGGVEPAEHCQRILIRRRRVELAGARERVFRKHHRLQQDDRDRQESAAACAPKMLLHFFLMSTLSRAGADVVTVTVWRDSPSSGWRNTTSCRPMVVCRLPIG